MAGEAKTGEDRRRKTRRVPPELPALLASGKNLAAIGEKLNLDPDTIRRWLRDKPELRSEVGRIQAERSEEVTRQLRGMDSLGMRVLEGVLDGGVCEECGRGPAEPRDRLKALHMLWSRTGRPEVSGVQLSGSVEVAQPTGAQAERVILSSAADILREYGYPDLASQLDDAIAAGPVEEG